MERTRELWFRVDPWSRVDYPEGAKMTVYLISINMALVLSLLLSTLSQSKSVMASSSTPDSNNHPNPPNPKRPKIEEGYCFINKGVNANGANGNSTPAVSTMPTTTRTRIALGTAANPLSQLIMHQLRLPLLLLQQQERLQRKLLYPNFAAPGTSIVSKQDIPSEQEKLKAMIDNNEIVPKPAVLVSASAAQRVLPITADKSAPPLSVSSVNELQNPNIGTSTPWCRLQSKYNLHKRDISICSPIFTIGSDKGCHLIIGDCSTNVILCRIVQQPQLDGRTITRLECLWGYGNVQINRQIVGKSSSRVLNSGDELIFNLGEFHYFSFQQLDTRAAATVSPSAGATEAQKRSAEPLTMVVDNKQNHASQQVPMSVVSSKSAAPKEDITSQIIAAREIQITFDNFPYYLCDKTKHLLVASVFLNMKHNEYARCNLELNGAVRTRILLSGPAGSETYQEKLSKALAHHFGATLQVFQSRLYPVAAGSLTMGTEPSYDLSAQLRPYLGPIYAQFFQRMNSLVGEMDVLHYSNAIAHGPLSQETLPSQSGKVKYPYFKKGDRVIFVGLNFGGLCSTVPTRGPSFGSRGKIVSPPENNYSSKLGVRFDIPVPEGQDLAGLCEAGYGYYCNKNELCLERASHEDNSNAGTLLENITTESRKNPFILFMKDVDKLLLENSEAHSVIKYIVDKLPENVVVIGSHTENIKEKESYGELRDNHNKVAETTKLLSELFPNKITVNMPEDETHIAVLKHQFSKDSDLLRAENNSTCLRHVLIRSGVECDELGTISVTDQTLTNESAAKVVKWAVGYQLMQYPQNNAKLVLSARSIQYGIDALRPTQTSLKSSEKLLKGVATENKFEESLLANVIPPNGIGVKFDDIGALENVKNTLKELVMLPLQRPELFCKGQLRKACKGILLFGPPGTGKTMLAKAVATEAGANFINISVSSIASKWYGEPEKYVRAIFSLASKIAPSVIFIDEVDSLLGQRRSMEHEATRKVKNEFMVNWDGLCTKDMERVLVLGATNRPFDLEEAVIRRMPHRLMVNLPDAPNRTKILRVILAKEELSPDVDLEAIGGMTDGYSGSDLKHLCVTAAYCPVREILEEEKVAADGKSLPASQESSCIRPINMEDFKRAQEQIAASVCTKSISMDALQQWNAQYGEGGSRGKPETPTYFI